MDLSNSFIYCHLLLLFFALGCHGCGRGAIKIQNNGYKDIVIAVSDKVTEDTGLLDRIKEVFTEASALLYTATRNRAYFEEITILVPSTWDLLPYGTAGKESFDKSDIVVDLPVTQLGRGDKPFTIKNTPCGEPGHYMSLTPGFFTNDSIANLYGSHDKVIIHEWAHLRYGVYDEYPSGSVSQFYADVGGIIEGVRCSKDITGTMINRVTGESCSYNGNIPEPDCVYVDNESSVTGSDFASLMYKSFLSQVSLFCDSNDDDGASKTRHNSNAPTDQNRLCDGRSVWDVLEEHKDFVNDTNPPREVTDTTPTFRVVQPKTFRTVLVLDRSGSMNNEGRLNKLRQGCYNYIMNVIHDGDYLGIVWFNSDAMAVKNLTQINNETRVELLDFLPTEAVNNTSIGGGIQEGLGILNEGNNTGGSLIVVTDGQENTAPFLIDVTAQVQEAEVTIHSIAISEDADSKLDLLATATGGLSFLYSGSNTSNAINEAFLKIGELNSDPTERHYVIRSKSVSLSSNDIFSETIQIDSSLGRSLQFTFDYSRTSITPSVTSPSGEEYTTTNVEVVTHDVIFGIYQFTITTVEPGEWSYSVVSSDPPQSLAVTVKAKSVEVGEYPIVASVHWGKTSIESIQPNVQNPTQELYASVSQAYSPVLNADVVATVERPDLSTVDLALLDNGAGADAFVGDGIYSAYFTQFNGQGRHGIKVTVESTEATIVSASRIIGRPVASRYSDSAAEVTVGVNNVSRNEAGESFQLQTFTGQEGNKFYLPAKISDLVVVSASYESRMVTLQWTAVGNQLDMGQASSYDLRLSTDFQQITANFSGQTQVTEDMVVSGGNLSQPKLAGELEIINITVPSKGAVTYIFAVKALDTDRREVAGPISNIASISLENFVSEAKDDTDRLSTAAIVFVSVGAALATVTVITIIAVVLFKQQAAVAKLPSPGRHMDIENKVFRPTYIRPQKMHGPYHNYTNLYRGYQPHYNYI